MTAENPPYTKQTAANKTMLAYGFKGISRTAWIISANRRKMRGYCVLIKSNQYKRYIFHFNKPAFLKRDSRRALFSESVPLFPEGSGETSKIKSNPPKRRFLINLKASRPRRLARFLETEFHALLKEALLLSEAAPPPEAGLLLGGLKNEKQIRL
jgi:hypothetical protein